MHKNRVSSRTSTVSKRSKRRGVSRAMLFFIFMILCTFALLVNGAIFSNRIQRVSAAPQK